MFMKFDLLGEERERELLTSAHFAVRNLLDKASSKKPNKNKTLLHIIYTR